MPARKKPYLVTFSYKTTTGAGGNPLVARVKTALEKGHPNGCAIKVEMRHGSAGGKFVHVDDTQAEGTHSKNFQEWMLHWKSVATESDLVVLFNSAEQGYNNSDGCMMEYRWATSNANYLPMKNFMANGATGEEMAKEICDALVRR